MTLPNGTGTDLFCSSQILLQSGNVLLTGGDTYVNGATTNAGNPDVNLFRPSDNSLSRIGTMNRPRWYGTATKLPNDSILIQGGAGGEDRAEVREPDGTFRLLSGFSTTDLDWWYPRNFVGPDGRVFGFSPNAMYRIDPTGNGTRTNLGSLPGLGFNIYSTSVMFAPNRILVCGGSTNAAAIIDIGSSGTPAVSQIQSLAQQRYWPSATVLPDGRVAVTGGGSLDNQVIENRTTLGTPRYQVELFDPRTNSWTTGPAAQRSRNYHSLALLLPDGSVLTAGGGAPGPVTNLDAEVYYPPYLFAASGSPAARPLVTGAPQVVDPRSTFTLTSPDAAAITRVTLVKTGAVTHSLDMEQRFSEPAFSTSGSTISVQMPQASASTPPGFYLVFVLNGAGTPSVGRIVRVPVDTVPAPPPPAPPPAGVPTTFVGSTEGETINLGCNTGEVLVGVSGRSGALINQVGPSARRSAQQARGSAIRSLGAWSAVPVERLSPVFARATRP